MTTAAERAGIYIAAGLSPIPLPFKSKKPAIPDWTALRITHDNLAAHFNGQPQNIGGLLGTASGGICDVDLDWPEAVQLAQHLLPASWQFGRGGQVRHVMVRAPGSRTTRFDAPVSLSSKEEGRRIVELLSDGTQVMLPGSMHPDTGEEIAWLTQPGTDLAELPADELLSRVQAIAGAAVLARLWPDLQGTRHDVVLALTGALHHAKWPHKRIEALLVALLKVAADPEGRDRAKAAHDTLQAACR
jgi:hypothetical protein